MNRRSFTLVEVLVALLVTAIVIPVALRALMVGAGLSESSDYQRQTARLADLKLQEFVIGDAWLETESVGDFGEDYPGYSWELATDEWTEGDIAMRRLDLTVRGPGRHGETVFSIATLVREPEG